MQRTTRFGLTLTLGATLAAASNAQFSVTSNIGDLVPNTGTGNPAGWDTANLDYDFTMTDPPGEDSVMVPTTVTSIESVEILGFSHTWSGDLQAILVDPAGVGHIIFLRPAIAPGTTCCGNSGDFLGGDYIFVEAGSNPMSQGVLPQAGDHTPGIFDQSFDTGAGVTWPTGDENVFNTPMGSITGPAGMWTLRIYDWAAGDTGSFTGFTLNGNGGGGLGSSYCGPAVANSTGNPATMGASGSDSIAMNDLTLTGASLPPNQFAYFLNSLTQGFVPMPTGSSGNLCLSGGIGRYNPNSGYAILNSGSAGTVMMAADLTAHPTPNGLVSVNPGETWNFQLWYRDAGGTSNFTDGRSISFQP